MNGTVARMKTALSEAGLSERAFYLQERLRAADPRLWRRNTQLRHEVDANEIPIPPTRLIVQVAGSADVGWFLEGGKLAAQSIIEVLGQNGLDLDQFDSMLDFGCGCGRVVRQWHALASVNIYGTDYNRTPIDWCRHNLDFARFATNAAKPPLKVQDSSFDFVYALSVFTHLPEDAQRAWITELTRTIRPGGYLLITTQGNYYRNQLTDTERERFDQGELIVRHGEAAGSNLCAAFHPESYIRERLALPLTVVDFVPEGALGNPYQDIVLLQKPE